MSETLPAPVPRKPIHTRRIAFEGFLREDGLWDIDCELSDTKAMAIEMRERGRLPPGEPVHLLRVRLTLDDSFTIRDVQTATARVPFGECHAAADEPMRKLVGLAMGPAGARRSRARSAAWPAARTCASWCSTRRRRPSR